MSAPTLPRLVPAATALELRRARAAEWLGERWSGAHLDLIIRPGAAPADRIALARVLVAGTGARVVTEDAR